MTIFNLYKKVFVLEIAKDSHNVIKRLAKIVGSFDDMNRQDYSYYIDEVIEKIAEIDWGGRSDDDMETSAEAEAKKIKQIFFDMSYVSDELEKRGMVAEAMTLDGLRKRMLGDFEDIEKGY